MLCLGFEFSQFSLGFRASGLSARLLIASAGRFEVNSRTGQIGHIVATAAMFLRSCVVQTLSRGDGSATRYTLRRNAASIMKIGVASLAIKLLQFYFFLINFYQVEILRHTATSRVQI